MKMNGIKVRKRFEMHGDDERDLQDRMNAFRQDIRARGGTILDIKWVGGNASSARCASVLYQVQLTAGEVEMPSL